MLNMCKRQNSCVEWHPLDTKYIYFKCSICNWSESEFIKCEINNK